MTQLVSHYTQIKAANAAVVTVSFGAFEWAEAWLQETHSPFPFLLDPQRTTYRAYGLESSLIRSWSPANLWYYTKAIVQGRQTFGRRGDTRQLGGDFIIDRHGILRLAHPGRDPTDRPGVDEIVAVLQKLD